MSGRVGLTRIWTRCVCARSALGVADDPAHGVAGGDGSGADELLARLQRDVGDLPRRGIDLIERARAIGIDLDRVDNSRLRAARRAPRRWRCSTRAADRLPRRRGLPPRTGFNGRADGSGSGTLDDLTGAGGSA